MKQKFSVILIIYLVLMLVTAVTVIVSVSDKNNISQVSYDYTDFSDGWINEKGITSELNNISECSSVTKILPDIADNTILYFNVKSMNIEVYIDDILKYSSKSFKNIFGKTSGSYFVEIPLFHDDSQKHISIKLNKAYDDKSAKITLMYLGNESSILKSQICNRMSGFNISLIISFLGVIFIILFVTTKKYNVFGKELIYLGLFSFSTGIFMLTDCKFLQVVTGQEHIHHMTSELFMMLITVPLLLFFKELYEEFNKKAVNTICIISFIVFAACYILNLTGIKDFHETVWLTHTSYVITIMYILFVTVKKLVKEDRKAFHHSIGVIFIAVFTMIDIFMLYLGSSLETSFHTRLGVLFFMCFEGIQIIKEHLAEYQEGVKAKLISQLAYHDGLTDLLNRTSFIEDMDNLENNRPSELLIAVFDVNNLKHINDNFGHTLGDKFIITAAKTIADSFGKTGKCYRTGGDEFVFISSQADTETCFLNSYEQMSNKLEYINLESVFPIPLTIAMGYSVSCDKTPHKIFDEADSNMYVNKKKLKEISKI